MKKYLKILISSFVSVLLLFTNLENVYAASATISVSSNKSTVLVGDTVTVTVKISSKELLGSWRWTLDYNSSKFKLTSGDSTVADAGDGKIKSKTYTYKLKAIATGTSSITVKSASALTWSEKTLSVSKGSKSIKAITQSEYKASLSKNNNLSSLSIEGLTLSPTFKSDVTEYKVTANANTTSVKIKAKVADSKSDLTGTGTFNVSEGENKFVISVTAQNGSVKKYTVIVNVTDPNPIKVTIDNIDYVVVKRESNLERPENYEKITVKINDQTVPGFHNEINDFTLIGLKNSDGETNLFIYNEKDNTFNKYIEATLDQIKLYPLKMDKQLDNYYLSKTTIDNIEFESLNMTGSNYSIIHGKDLDDGKDYYYIYDSDNKTLIKYTDDFIKPYKEKIKKYEKLVSILIVETIFIILVLIGILINRIRINKKRKKLLEKKKQEYIKHKQKKLEEIKEKPQSKKKK